MSKKLIVALLLLAISALVLVFNTKGLRINVNLIFFEVSAMRALVFFAFEAVGVLIGLFLTK